jgi:DNA-binding LacI/PurR family transcriptional regulator
MEQARSAVTLGDVARLANTSPSTVSRVVANRGNVSEALRSRVIEAVRQTGFAPNTAASSLARRRTVRSGLCHKAIAVGYCGYHGEPEARHLMPVLGEVNGGILEAAGQMDLAAMSCLLDIRDLEQGIPPAGLPKIPFDGLLVMPGMGVDCRVLSKIAPTVMFGFASYDPCEFTVVQPDIGAGINALVDHLCRLGHQRLDYLMPNVDSVVFRERAALFTAATQRHSVAGRVVPQADPAAHVSDLARRPAGQRPTAVVASSDEVGASLLRALADHGVRVPAEVSVVGFGGSRVSEHCWPPLTTWHVHWRELGQVSLRTLVDLVEARPVPARVLMGGDLIVRRSTGPAPGKNGG